MPPLHVLFTVNSSLLIWSEHTKLLIDGLHGPSLQFSDMAPQARLGLSQSTPPFDHIDALLFTHGHPDHFSLKEVSTFLAGHSVSCIILPADSGQPPETDGVLRPLLPPSTQYLKPCTAPWAERSYTLGDFKITYLHTPHIPMPLWPCEHYSILLEYHGTTVFIGGDMAFPGGEQLQLLCAKGIDYGFFVPFYILHRNGQRALSTLHPKMSYIYHMPFPEKKSQEFLELVDQHMAVYAERLAPIQLLRPGMPVFTIPAD